MKKLPLELQDHRFVAVGDEDSASVETDGGQWIVAFIDTCPFPEDPDCSHAPWSALAVAQTIADALNGDLLLNIKETLKATQRMMKVMTEQGDDTEAMTKAYCTAHNRCEKAVRLIEEAVSGSKD